MNRIMNYYEHLKIKDKILFVIVVISLVFIIIQKIFFPHGDKVNSSNMIIQIKDIKIIAEVSKNQQDLYNGLSNYIELEDNRGMLFVHDKSGKYKYVMRDMNFGLDFIFIKNNVIVDIMKNVPKDYKKNIQGIIEYDSVLEVKMGLVDKNGIELGDKITIE